MTKFRQPFVVAAFFLIAAIPALTQEKSPNSAKFLALEDKWNEAYKRGDIEAMNALLADDFIITVEDGVTYSKAGYIAHLRNTSEHVAVAEISNVKVRVHGNVAIVTGAYNEKGTSNGAPYGYRDRL